MASFQLNDGTKMVPNIDAPTIKRIRKELDVDLAGIFETDILERLRLDVILFVDVLYLTCEKQCLKNKITDEQFGAGLKGDAIADATRAFLEELTSFTLPAQRPALTKAITKMDQVMEKQVELAQLRIEDPKIMELVQAQHEAATNQMDEILSQARAKSGS